MRLRCRSNNLSHRGVSYTTGRIVYHPFKRLFIIGIYSQAEVSNHIFNFLALVKRESSVNAVRQGMFAQSFLEDTRLGIRAVKNGKVGIGIILSTMQFPYFIHHNFTLFHVRIGIEQRNRLSRFFLGKDFLANLFLILLYQAVSRLHYHSCGTIILLQLKEFGSLILLGKL